MRELKFRAWDRILGCWSRGTQHIITDGGGVWYPESGNRYTFVQYTGLHDKKGVEICEGDIVKGWHHEFEEEWVESIRYKAPSFTMGNRRYWKDGIHDWYSMEQFDSFEIEVIGNIYENPELLQESECQS